MEDISSEKHLFPKSKIPIQMELDCDEPVLTKDENSISSGKNNVQLQVDEREIRRRISDFMSRKRKEVDEFTVQEFCSRPFIDENNLSCDQTASCARVDAIFIPRFGGKSHVKVSKVENRWGPQTHLRSQQAKLIKSEPDMNTSTEQHAPLFDAILERVQNMEAHVQLKPDRGISIFQRLKFLEDRILYLEGIPLDYINLAEESFASPKKKNLQGKEKKYANWTVEEIQKRIQVLKDSLKAKSQKRKEQFQTENSTPVDMQFSESHAQQQKTDIPSMKKSSVQLQENEDEIKRMVQAFVTKKRNEVDESVVNEYCNRPYVDEKSPGWDQIDSCARVDAVFVPRQGEKSHIKLIKVDSKYKSLNNIKDEVNKIVGIDFDSSDQKTALYETNVERIQNVESNAQMKMDYKTRNSLSQRLKDLENRILYLESKSSDFFKLSGSDYMSLKKRNVQEKEKLYSNWSVIDIEKRMKALKELLKSKIKREI